MNIVRVENSDRRVCYGVEGKGTVRRIAGDIFGEFNVTDELLDPIRRLAPVEPCQIYAIGLNYREHAAEMHAAIPEYPVVFSKSITAVAHPDGAIILPRHLHSDQVDYEGELAVVIGRRCKNVTAAEALDYVLGYTCANDVSARDWQKNTEADSGSRGRVLIPSARSAPCSLRQIRCRTRRSCPCARF